MCPCGEAEQTTQHILQDCRNHRLLREETWPTPAPIQEKLHGPVDVLQKTTDFISRAYSPSVTTANEKKKYEKKKTLRQ